MINPPPPSDNPPMRIFYCAECDQPIIDQGEFGFIMQYDENGVYHVRCFENREERRKNEVEDPAWD